MSELVQGRVIRHDGPRFWVEIDGAETPCVLRGRLKKEFLRVTSLVTVGDLVEVKRLPDGSGAISAVRPRRTELSRVGHRGYVHVMAANIDVMLVVMAAQQPRFKRSTVERLMLVARKGGMEPVVVVNKCDLEEPAVVAGWVEPLAAAGTPVVLASTVTGQGIADLRALISGRTAVLVGPSGVGKSSLVNALFPGFDLRTQGVSGYSNKGRHTTTTSRLYPVPGGGYLADTPGIKDIGLADGEETAVGDVFPEIEAMAGACKFRDCSHVHEPGCAVKQALAAGKLEQARYRSYLKLAGRR